MSMLKYNYGSHSCWAYLVLVQSFTNGKTIRDIQTDVV